VAFTIIPGSSTAPTTYEGTDGVDAAAIFSLPNGSTGVDVTALGADDLVNWGVQLANSSIRGGDGNDLLTPNIISGATLIASFVNGNAGDDTLGGNIQLGISATITSVLGGQGNDVIYSNNLQSSRLNGNLGDDEIFVGFGIAGDKTAISATVNIANSQIFGGQGDDLISITGGGTSVVRGYFSTEVDGNLGDDEILVNIAGDAAFQNSVIAGGDGNDLIDAAGVTFDGGSFVDLVIEGGEGDDTIYGGEGNDAIDTGNGRNLAFGEGGADTIVGGEGEDTIFGGQGADEIFGGLDADVIEGGADDDFIDGEEGDDDIFGSTGSDTIIGGTGADTLAGFTGRDVIDGGDGSDRILGGADADRLTGGDGFNTFVQRAGATSTANSATDVGDAGILDGGDTLFFNAGADGPDIITDWTTTLDELDTGFLGLETVGGAPFLMSYGVDFTTLLAGENIALRGEFIVNGDGTSQFVVGADGTGSDIGVLTAGVDAAGTDQAILQSTNLTVLLGAGAQTLTSGNFVLS